MATRVILNGHQGMRINSKPPSILSDDDDGVQSGSATGFSDEHEDLSGSHIQPTRLKKPNMAFDPVTQILDKIDAELSSLTRSQASSSTATDSTIVRCPASHMSTESGSRLDNGDSLTMSQLGSTIQKPTYSSISSGSRPPGSIDRDTGIGTATSSFNTDRQRSRSVEDRRVLDLEPGDAFKDKKERALSPDFSYLNGHHIGQSDDDKSKQERQGAAPFEAKNVDEKFKEIMQKRKGYLSKAGTDDDNQTIRTEDFVEKFQDTMVYSSADEAEKIRNLEDDLHSDGGSDTDTLQQKLAMLSRTSLPTKDGRTSPCPAPRPLDCPRQRIAQSFETKPMKVGGPGTPPVYPKPTPTASLPRPSTRSPLKLAPGNTSDADSVRTEDFENRFKDMLMMGKERETGESDLDGGMTSDPIHTKVKELLKATAKYDNHPAPFTTSILKSRYKTLSDKPKPELKPKPHVRISPKLPQYQDQDKGDDSDDTLCSDKDNRVASPRSWSGWFWRQNPNGPGLVQDYATERSRFAPQVSNSSSLDDSLSKSSHSLSASSVSSCEREKLSYHRTEENNINKHKFLKETNPFGFDFSRQVSQISSADSSYSDYSQNNSRSESTSESLVDDELSYLHALYLRGADRSQAFPSYQSSQFSGALRRRSISDGFNNGPYIHKKVSENMKKEKKKEKKRRDLIVQDEEEEEFPFSKYTFNKKTNSSSKSEDSSSVRSSISQRSASRDSICSTGVMNQFLHLKKGNKRLLQNSLSSNSLFSTMSSLNDTYGSADEFSGQFDSNSFDMKHRQPSYYRTQMSNGPGLFPQASFQQDRPSFNAMSASPTYPSSNMEQMLSNLGINLPSSLPERFLKSLVDKLYVSQQEEMVRHMVPPFIMPTHPQDNYSYPEDHDLPPSVSAQHSGASTPMWRQSFDNLQNISDTGTRLKRQQLHRANTINNSSSFSMTSSCHKDSQDEHCTDNLYSQVGPLPLQKENSFDKLKRILQTTDRIQHHREKDMRRSMYGLNRQKSLPLFLETLSEEDEERRRSRTPSFDKSKGVLNAGSKLRSLHEDLERSSAKSSEDTSDTSRRSSLNQNMSVADVLFSAKKSFSTIENDGDSCSTNELFEEGQHKSSPKHESHQNVPSILVTGRDIDNSYGMCDGNKFSNFDTDNERFMQFSQSNYSGDNKNIGRPKSPTPGRNEEDGFVSKDSLEVAEILSPTDKKLPVISVLSKIDSINEEEKVPPDVFMSNSTNKHGDDSNKYLKICDYDDRHLSHTPSTASPISPITVIDMAKLDNQIDSCEFDDVFRSVGTSSSDKVSITFGDNKSNMSANAGRVSKTSNTSGSKSNNQHQGTGSLVLERRSYYADPVSDSERNTSEEQVEVDVEHKYDDRSVQASLEPLTPLMSVSELSRMLEHLFRKFPQQGDNLFYLAQDKEVQCDLLKEAACQYCCNKQDTGVLISAQRKEQFNPSKNRNSKIDVSENISSERLSPSMFTNTTNGAFNYKTSVTKKNTGSTKTNKHCTYKTFTAHEKKKQYSINDDNVSKSQDKPIESPKTFRSEAFFILKQLSSEESDIEKVQFKSHKYSVIDTDTKDDCSVKVKKIKHTTTNKGMKRKHSVCRIVTEAVDDPLKDNIISHIYVEDGSGAGFEEIVSSYVNHCKQGVTEGTSELKSPNSLTVERFEYEPWDTLDLRKVLDVFEKNIAVDSDQELSDGYIEKDSYLKYSLRNTNHMDNIGQVSERKTLNMQTNHANIYTNKDYERKVSIGNHEVKCQNVGSSETDLSVQRMEETLPLNARYLNNLESEIDFDRHDMLENPHTPSNDSGSRFTSKATLTFTGNLEPYRVDNKILSNPQTTRNIKTHAKSNSLSNDMTETAVEGIDNELFTSTLYFNFVNTSSKTKSCTSARIIKDFGSEIKGETGGANTSNNFEETCKGLKTDFKNEKSILSQIKSGSLKEKLSYSVNDNKKSSSSYIMTSERQLPNPSICLTNDTQKQNTNYIESVIRQNEYKGTINESFLTDQNQGVNESTNTARKTFKLINDRDVTETSRIKNEEISAEKLCSRSLDYETYDSRKNILQRCNNAAFSKTFDIFGSFNEYDLIDSRPDKSSIPNFRNELADQALDKLHESLQNFECQEEDLDEDAGTRCESRSVQYQIGVKEDENGDVCDIYGRIRIVNSDNDEGNETLHHYLHTDDVNETLHATVDGLLPYEDRVDGSDKGDNNVHDKNDANSIVYNEVISEPDYNQSKDKTVFDIFAQIDEDADDIKDIWHTDKVTQELERLYNQSIDEDYASDSKTAMTDVSQRLSFSSILEELDHEISQIEAYQNRFQYYESHVCKNCGHTVSITTVEKTQGQIEHDYCRECSPLDLTAEMLERRRLEKMMQNSIDNNKSTD